MTESDQGAPRAALRGGCEARLMRGAPKALPAGRGRGRCPGRVPAQQHHAVGAPQTGAEGRVCPPHAPRSRKATGQRWRALSHSKRALQLLENREGCGGVVGAEGGVPVPSSQLSSSRSAAMGASRCPPSFQGCPREGGGYGRSAPLGTAQQSASWSRKWAAPCFPKEHSVAGTRKAGSDRVSVLWALLASAATAFVH